MSIVGTTLLSIVVPPVDQVFRIRFRVVHALPFGAILGTEFVYRHRSIITFEDGGSFKPTLDTQAVSLLLPHAPPNTRLRTPGQYPEEMEGYDATHLDPLPAEAKSPTLQSGWTAAPFGRRSGRIRCQHTGDILQPSPHLRTANTPPLPRQETFFAVDRQTEDLGDQDDQPPQVMTMEALGLGSTLWEDEGSLQWTVTLSDTQDVDERVSTEAEAELVGPQPNTSHLKLIFPLKPFDLEGDVRIGIAKGAQWFTAGSPLRVKLVNRSTSSKSIGGGVQVAIAYGTNSSDIEGILLLKEPKKSQSPIPNTSSSMKEPEIARSGEPDSQIRVCDANTGQLGPEGQHWLLKILEDANARGAFPAGPKIVPAWNGREVTLPLKDAFKNAPPCACRPQHYSLIEAEAVNKQTAKWLEADVVEFSNSECCSQTLLVRKPNGDFSLCIDYRELNKRLKSDQGGLGSLSSMHRDGKDNKFFTLLDMPAAFHQLKIGEKDRDKTAFRGADGRLYQFRRCGFGLKTISSVFTASLRDTLRPALDRGVKKWLVNVLLHSKTFKEHLELLEFVLNLLIEAGFSIHFDKSELCFSKVEFLGVMVGREGVRIAPSKIKAFQDMRMPRTVGEVRTFLGLANFLRNHVANFSAVTAPLTDLLGDERFRHRRANRLAVPWWSPAQTDAFYAGTSRSRCTQTPAKSRRARS